MAVKLSIIIPVYNAERFIQKSYENIRNQNIVDFELIYVNNNSVDNSIKLIKELQERDSSVKLFHETKQGAAAARNLGINKSLGQYLYVFDVDDEIYPDALKRMMQVLDSNQSVDAVFGNMVKSRKGIKETEKPSDESHKVVIHPPPYWGLRWFEDLSTVVGPPAFLYRASVFKKIGLYNEELVICEDTALDIKLGMLCTIAHLDSYVYLYFVHESSILQKSKKEISQIFILWSRLIKSHLPFYLSHPVPVKYKQLTFNQLFSSMGKIVYYTDGIGQRMALIKKIKSDIIPYKLPLIVNLYLNILAICPIRLLLKFYIYYLAPWIVKRNINTY